MVKTINIKDETHTELCEVGHKGESFDTVINKLIAFYYENIAK